jgi:hypothetical protein
MSRKNKESNDRYLQLHHFMLKTAAWLALSAPARAIYIQIGFRYNGANNGKIAYSVRDAASECNLAINTAARAFKELVDRGFIEERRHGGLSKKTRIASEWRLTAYKCDLTGEFKTCTFMHRGGPEHSSYSPQKRGPLPGTSRPSPVSINSRECLKKLHSLSQLTPVDEADCLKQLYSQADFEPPPVSNNYTHIVYQSRATDGRAILPPPIPRAETAPTALTTPPDELPPTPDMIPWTPPRRPKIDDEALVLGGRSISGRPAPIDALTELEGLLLSNALPDGSVTSDLVH